MDFNAILEKYFSDKLEEATKTEISTLIEAAINEKVNVKLEEKQTELEEKYTGELTEFKTSLIDVLADYLEETFNEWCLENEVRIVSQEKVLMADNMAKQILGLCKENHIEVNEEDIDVVKDLETQVVDLKAKVNESGNTNITLKKQINEYEKAVAFTNLTEDMTEVDREKLLTLVEDIDAKDVSVFKTKVKIIKEKFNTNISDTKENVGDNSTENTDLELNESVVKSEINKYLPKVY